MSTKNYDKAREIAAETIMLLLDRKGFDDLWHDFGPENRAEILDAIVETAEKIIDGEHAKNWKKRVREFYEDYTEDVREAFADPEHERREIEAANARVMRAKGWEP